METFENLKQLGDELEQKGLTKSANIVTNAMNNLLKFITAQYVGSQGYAIRNRRCFDNCYRQKRAEKPTMAAQEVWFTCLDEYKKSINDDKSGWEKYAEESENTFIKTAAKNDNILKSYFDEKIQYNRLLKDKIASNVDLPIAIQQASQEVGQQYIEGLLTSANDLTKVASHFEKQGEKALSEKLFTASLALVKEAQFNANFFSRDWWEDKKDSFLNKIVLVQNRLQRVLEEVENMEARFSPNMTKDMSDAVNKELDILVGKMRGELEYQRKLIAKDPKVRQVFPQIQNVFSIFIQAMENRQYQSRRESLNYFDKNLNLIISGLNQNNYNAIQNQKDFHGQRLNQDQTLERVRQLNDNQVLDYIRKYPAVRNAVVKWLVSLKKQQQPVVSAPAAVPENTDNPNQPSYAASSQNQFIKLSATSVADTNVFISALMQRLQSPRSADLLKNVKEELRNYLGTGKWNAQSQPSTNSVPEQKPQINPVNLEIATNLISHMDSYYLAQAISKIPELADKIREKLTKHLSTKSPSLAFNLQEFNKLAVTEVMGDKDLANLQYYYKQNPKAVIDAIIQQYNTKKDLQQALRKVLKIKRQTKPSIATPSVATQPEEVLQGEIDE